MMGEVLTKDDCKDLLEKVAQTLKDMDPMWIDFDAAPRTHKNHTYSCIYQKLYKRLTKPSEMKEAKPAIKKE